MGAGPILWVVSTTTLRQTVTPPHLLAGPPPSTASPTARGRWGVVQSDSCLRGYNQFYISAVAEPIFRGPENHYFGFNFGLRYNFVRPGSRFVPYFSGGLGLGWIDSHPNIPGAQGQDFTFNILTAAGISYKMTERWKLNAGILYQHLSNGGQTDPNPSLNLLGPQVGLNYSF